MEWGVGSTRSELCYVDNYKIPMLIVLKVLAVFNIFQIMMIIIEMDFNILKMMEIHHLQQIQQKQQNLFLPESAEKLNNIYFLLKIIFCRKFQTFSYNHNLTSIMVAVESLKRLVYQFDMFCSSELLRHRSETQYKTLTGGLLSFAIICVVAVGFASMVRDTLERVTITSSLITLKSSNPPFVSLVPGHNEMFMMGFSIQSIDLSFQADLNSGPQYFSVVMTLIQIIGGIQTNRTRVPLEQCTHQHWAMMPEFNFDAFSVDEWLCLPLGVQLPLQGTYTSPVNNQISIQVVRCQDSISNNSCATKEQIDALFQLYRNFYMTWNYINPVINPNQQNFLSYYIEGNDYIIFSSDIGSEAWVYFSDYSVTTDDSIWPFSHNSKASGCIVEQKAINHPYSVISNNSFASVYLSKSSNSLIYNRQVQKISAVLSYIGGLIGAITAVLFLIKSYTDTSLEVTIGLSLFEASQEQKLKENNKDNDKEKLGQKGQEKDTKSDEEEEKQKQKEQPKSFNFFGFMRLACYRLLRFCAWIEPSEQEEYLQECQQQALKQMDIELLLRRVIKLQTCMSHLFTLQELQQIKEGQQITIKSAKKMRTLLLKENQGHQARNSKVFQIKNQIELNDAVIQQNSASQGESSAESAISINKDGSDRSKKVSLIDKQQTQIRESSSGMLGIDKQKLPSFNFFQRSSDETLTRQESFQKVGSRNRIYPGVVLPPIDRREVGVFSLTNY